MDRRRGCGRLGGRRVVALRVQMTAMPQMVALLNGFGGAASALVAGAELLANVVDKGGTPTGIVPTAIVLSVLIGAVTFTGSLIAFAKLQELMTAAPITYPGQQVVNGLMRLVAIGLCVLVAMDRPAPAFWALMALSLVLGVLLVIPIGGADMPVVISLLNSYSGLAACATGFVLGNSALVISGSLVGASGIILTKIMCDAMNRSICNVLFGAFGAAPAASAGAAAAVQRGNAKAYTPEDAAVIFSQRALVHHRARLRHGGGPGAARGSRARRHAGPRRAST